MSTSSERQIGIERWAVAFGLSAPATVVFAHGASAIFAGIFSTNVEEAAAMLSYGGVAVAVAALLGRIWLRGTTKSGEFAPALGVSAVAAIAGAAVAGELGMILALLPALLAAAIFSVWVLGTIVRKLPDVWDGARARRPILAYGWAALALIALIETTRISTFMSNLKMPGTSDSMLRRVADHLCMSAYFYAADLNRQGRPNLYAESHYPLAAPSGKERPPPGVPTSSVTVGNMAPYVIDSYQYPPPFLLLPHAGLTLNNDFLLLRTEWFAGSWLALAFVAFAVAIWAGGRTGAIACLLVPLVMVSGPTSLGLQRGQFHPAAWAIAVGAMLAFEKKKFPLGGALLSFVVLSKIFPGVLGIYLIASRRWRAVAWTFGGAAMWLVLSLIVLGTAPFEAFLEYQLPRLSSGEAFNWCFGRPSCVINNQSPAGLPYKLAELGWLSNPAAISKVIATIYPLFVAAIAVWAGLRTASDDSAPEARAARARAWTSVALLASLMPRLAPASYAPIGSLLTLMLLGGLVRSTRGAILLALAWLAAFQLPVSPPDDLKLALSAVTVFVLLAVNGWTAVMTKWGPIVGVHPRNMREA